MKPACEIIKEIRIKNGISQKELAEKVGMTQQAIALLENGKRKIEFDLFIKIIEVLKEPLVDVFINIGISEKDLRDKLGYIITSNFENSFDDILKAHGAIIYINDDDNYTIKYNNKIATLTDVEYYNFENEICRFIEYSLDRLVNSSDT